MRGVGDHGDGETEGNFEDIGVVHHFECAVNVVGEAVELAGVSFLAEFDFDFFFLAWVEFQIIERNFGVGELKGIGIHFEGKILNKMRGTLMTIWDWFEKMACR